MKTRAGSSCKCRLRRERRWNTRRWRCGRWKQVVSKVPDIVGAFSVIGFSFTGNGPNKGIIFINLKDAKDRKGSEHSASAIVNSSTRPT